MRKNARIFFVLAALFLLAGGALWLDRSTRPPEDSAPDTSTKPGVKPGETPLIGGAGPGSESFDSAPLSAGDASDLAEEDMAEAAPAWPSVGDILAEPGDDFVAIARKLAALTVDGRIPMEEREEALAHTLNLAAGNEAEVLTPLVKDPNLPDPLAERILDEALNSTLSYQADLYLTALAARKSPELQTKIREHLAFLTDGEDRGPKPEDWRPAIAEAKKEWPE